MGGRRVADDLAISPAQLALAWLLHQGEDIYPTPGSRKTARVDENAQAQSISLSDEVCRTIDELMAPGTALGATLVQRRHAALVCAAGLRGSAQPNR